MGKDQDLLQAVKEQDVSAVHKILSKAGRTGKKLIGSTKKLNINYQDGDGMSSLHQASLMGNTAIMQILLEGGAHVGVKDNKGMTPLHYAAWQGKLDPVNLLLLWRSPANEEALNGDSPLHLACQHGHYEVVKSLLNHHADPTLRNKEAKTPLDLACEFGRSRVVEMLLKCNVCGSLLVDGPADMENNSRTTCLHLAARNGHSEIIKFLLKAGVNINRTTLQGTCLHEAAMYGKTDIVQLLLDYGADVNKPNSYDQTALDVVNKFTTSRAAKDLKQILKEASFAVYARAVKDCTNIFDTQCLSFKEGDFITVLEQKPDGLWKGYVMHEGHSHMAKTGFFPADHVVLVDNSVQPSRCSCGLYIYESLSHSAPSLPMAVANHQRTGPPKKVNLAQVPDLLNPDPTTNGSIDRRSYGSVGVDDAFPPPPSPLVRKAHGHRDHDHASSPVLSGGHQYLSHRLLPNQHQHTVDNVDWAHTNGEVMRSASPAKDSPSNSNRNSAASSDSGRGVTTGQLDARIAHNFVNVQISNHHRLSGQSYESGVSSRQSYHSNSSSSLGSLDRLEESGYSSQINVSELFQAGVPDSEVLLAWLSELHFDEYFNNFLQAGYDMPTISRMTPEDLTAIGITKPAHRKRLKAEIARLTIPDGIPDHKPHDLVDWLRLLNLDCYYETLMGQGFDNIDNVTDITWEDLEEIGIQQLGHQKKMMLAIDRLKRITSGINKRLSNNDSQRRGEAEMLDPPSTTTMCVEMIPTPQYSQEVSIATIKPRKSPSGENLNGNSTGPELKTFQQQPREGEAPTSRNNSEYASVTPLYQAGLRQSERSNTEQLRQHGSNSVESATAASRAAHPGRKTPNIVENNFVDGQEMFVINQTDNLAFSPKHHQKVVPAVATKPKPVAKIVAKTRRSSRECSPDIPDSGPQGTSSSSEGSGQTTPTNTLKIQKNCTLRRVHSPKVTSEHTYDQPVVNSPKALIQASSQPPFVFLKPVPAFSQTQSVPPTVQLHVTTAHTTSGNSPMASPGKSPKRMPPPPPKRSNSMTETCRVDREPGPKPEPLSPKPVLAAPQQQEAFASCVKNLSARFGKMREEKRNDNSGDTSSISDSEEFPPPPPPVAMDIITPKLHNYGILGKSGKVPLPRDSPERTGFLQRQVSSPVNFTTCNSYHDRSASPGTMTLSRRIDASSRDKCGHYDSATLDRRGIVAHGPRNETLLNCDLNTSTTSVDSNTLPFANENVGTIKQRVPPPKPSIVQMSESLDGNRNLDLNSSLFEERSSTLKRTPPSALHYGAMVNHSNDPHLVSAQKDTRKGCPPPPIARKPSHMGKSETCSDPVPTPVMMTAEDALKPKRSTETGDVLSDIDNMLADLTDELDAMLDLELDEDLQ